MRSVAIISWWRWAPVIGASTVVTLGGLALAVTFAGAPLVVGAAASCPQATATTTAVSFAGEPPLVQYYIGAAQRYGLGPGGYAYLAAINYVETSFGTDLSTSSAGAIGWMQFEPDTWRAVRGGGLKPGRPA